MKDLRARGWTDAMVREYLGSSDAERPNPRYQSGAPVRLYLSERVEAAEGKPTWASRQKRAAIRREAGLAAVARKRLETAHLARGIARALTADLELPADLLSKAIGEYNRWHSENCNCPSEWSGGFCDKRASAGDSPVFLRRISVNYVRHELTGYDRAYHLLARRVGQQQAHELLRSKVNAAIEAKLDALPGESRVPAAAPV